MARAGKSEDSQRPLTVYLPPLTFIALEELAHDDRTRVSEWVRNVVEAAVRKRLVAAQNKSAQLSIPGLSSKVKTKR